jgi:hypothetical protein
MLMCAAFNTKMPAWWLAGAVLLGAALSAALAALLLLGGTDALK